MHYSKVIQVGTQENSVTTQWGENDIHRPGPTAREAPLAVNDRLPAVFAIINPLTDKGMCSSVPVGNQDRCKGVVEVARNLLVCRPLLRRLRLRRKIGAEPKDQNKDNKYGESVFNCHGWSSW
jgi:hypothetical protein